MRTKPFLKQILIFVLGIITVFFQTELKAQPAPKPRQYKSPNNNDTSRNAAPGFDYIIIRAPHNTYGYDIYDYRHRLIHQPSIPGLPGNDGFKTKADALKVAKLVCDKLKKGEMPPSVSIKELKQLKIIQ
jgi:hypothetical protein